MTIKEALKEHNIEVRNGKRWLVWDKDNWAVFERPYGARTSQVLVQTADEEEAVACLIE